MTFFEMLFEAEVVILSLYFGIISVVEGVSKTRFLPSQVRRRAKFSAWYMFALSGLTGLIMLIQEYYPDGVNLAASQLQLNWVYGSESAFLLLVLLLVGLGLVLSIALYLLEKAEA